jgi:hypothetical protein
MTKLPEDQSQISLNEAMVRLGYFPQPPLRWWQRWLMVIGGFVFTILVWAFLEASDFPILAGLSVLFAPISFGIVLGLVLRRRHETRTRRRLGI